MRSVKWRSLAGVALIGAALHGTEIDTPSNRSSFYAYKLRTLPDTSVMTEQYSSLPAGWHARTLILDPQTHSSVSPNPRSGIFGELIGSRRAKDRQDVFLVRPMVGKLTVVFPHGDWGEERGNYLSDYRPYDLRKPLRLTVWPFQIRIPEKEKALKNAGFRIAVDGPYGLDYFTIGGKIKYIETLYSPQKRKYLHLLDLDHNRSYPYERLSGTTFSMEGKSVRSFAWIYGGKQGEKLKNFPRPVPPIPYEEEEESATKKSGRSRKLPEFIPAPPKPPGSRFGPPPIF